MPRESQLTTFSAYPQEFDTPAKLYEKQDGIFRGMCERSSITLDDIKLGAKALTDD